MHMNYTGMAGATMVLLAGYGTAHAGVEFQVYQDADTVGSLDGPVEIVGDDLLIRGATGVHRFSGAGQCPFIAEAPYVNVRMRRSRVDSRGGGKADVIYGQRTGGVRTCEVTYKGLYEQPKTIEVTPLEG